MNKQINESIKFLLNEFKRLKLKENNNTITKEESETLKKITLFIGKENE
tara:strand:- start:384 stop:530 length:147 start_codon:yes stop_codon:yes gene_type:complete